MSEIRNVEIRTDRLDRIRSFLDENEEMLKNMGRYNQAPDMDYVVDLLLDIIDNYKYTLENENDKKIKLYREIEKLYFFKVASLHPLLHLSINKEYD